MTEHTYNTSCGTIHYWLNREAELNTPQLIFLPGLTADHRLFDKQIEFFKGKYPVLTWDAPAHASSWPFQLTFSLMDKAVWLEEILEQEDFQKPVIIGQSMGGYVGQAFAELFPEKIQGFVSIDSAPLQRRYITDVEICLLKRVGLIYRYYPWKSLLKNGPKQIAVSEYGRELMTEMMKEYDGVQKRYANIAGHGFRILAEAMEADLPYSISCPALLICGKKDHAGSAIRYNKQWHKHTGIPIQWIEDAGHNANTDQPDRVNHLLEDFIKRI